MVNTNPQSPVNPRLVELFRQVEQESGTSLEDTPTFVLSYMAELVNDHDPNEEEAEFVSLVEQEIERRS